MGKTLDFIMFSREIKIYLGSKVLGKSLAKLCHDSARVF